jgi:hypothetical protein
MHWGSLSEQYRVFVRSRRAQHELRQLIARGAVAPTMASADVAADHLRASYRDRVDVHIAALAAAIRDRQATTTAWALLWFALEVDLIGLFDRRVRDRCDDAIDLEAQIALALFDAVQRAHRSSRAELLAGVVTSLRDDGSWRHKRWLVKTDADADARAIFDDVPTRLAVRRQLRKLSLAEQDAIDDVVILGESRVAAGRERNVSRHEIRRRLTRAMRRLRRACG